MKLYVHTWSIETFLITLKDMFFIIHMDTNEAYLSHMHLLIYCMSFTMFLLYECLNVIGFTNRTVKSWSVNKSLSRLFTSIDEQLA